MKSLAFVVALTGCGYQMSVHAGPRTDLEGRVGVEVGMTMGAAVFRTGAQRTSAVVASIEGAPYVTTGDSDCHTCTTARGTTMPSLDSRGRAAIRGMLEWVTEARTDERGRYVRAPGIARRFGVYGGVDMDEHERLGLVGVTAGVSPWVLTFSGRVSEQWLSLGARLATELIPGETGGHRVVVRALLQADVVYQEPRR